MGCSHGTSKPNTADVAKATNSQGSSSSGKTQRGPTGRASVDKLATQEHSDEAAFVRELEVGLRVLAYVRQKMHWQNTEEKTQGTGREKVGRRASKDAVGEPCKEYTGYHLPQPFSAEGALGLMNHFLTHGTRKPLHIRYVKALVSEFTRVYAQTYPKPVVEVDVPQASKSDTSGTFVVVGDTHGQLNDVLHIFHEFGVPSSSNVYLFNGDIADRGNGAVEIFLLVFAFFLADPSTVIINRGNHENEALNSRSAAAGGGFLDEVLTKYNDRVYHGFVGAFKVLSLGTLVQKECFVVHGGLCRGANSMPLEFLNTIDHQHCTVPDPKSTCVKDRIFSDLLWSDPVDQVGLLPSKRGFGVNFGPDVTKQFCDNNSIRYVLRSHQLPKDQRGFMAHHEGKIITVFSASNYCGVCGNYGAVLTFKSNNFPKYEIKEHYAPPLEMLPHILGKGENWDEWGKAHELECRENLEEARQDQLLDKMAILVIENKPELWAHFMDIQMLGGQDAITVSEWEAICQEVMGTGLPWLQACTSWDLAMNDAYGDRWISASNFLGKCSVSLVHEQYASFKQQVILSVYESMLHLDMNLKETFELIDKNGDSRVDMNELRQVLSMFDLGLTKLQLDSFIRSFFKSAMKTGATKTQTAPAPSDSKQNSSATVSPENVGLTEDPKDEAPRKRQAPEDSEPRPQDWLSQGSALQDGNASITVSELFDRFTVVYRQRDDLLTKGGNEAASLAPWMESALGKIGRLMATTPVEMIKGGQSPKSSGVTEVSGAKGAAKMREIFEIMDTDRSGFLEIQEFVEGVAMLPGLEKVLVEGVPCTKEKVMELAKAVDLNESGSINYLEFLQAFCIETNEDDDGDELVEHITTVLFRHRLAIRSGCYFFDKLGSGKITNQQLLSVFEGLNTAISLHERHMTHSQIELLVEALTGEDGFIDYQEFLRSFHITGTTSRGNLRRLSISKKDGAQKAHLREANAVGERLSSPLLRELQNQHPTAGDKGSGAEHVNVDSEHTGRVLKGPGVIVSAL